MSYFPFGFGYDCWVINHLQVCGLLVLMVLEVNPAGFLLVLQELTPIMAVMAELSRIASLASLAGDGCWLGRSLCVTFHAQRDSCRLLQMVDSRRM